VKKTCVKEFCSAMLAFLLIAPFAGCSKSAPIGQRATENAQLSAENELVRSSNTALKAQTVKSAPTTPTEETPPKAEIDRAVNQILAKRIDWEVTSTNLFTDYKITNHYKEEARGYTYFIYEFTADCDVAASGGSVRVDAFGREHHTYLQPEAARQMRALNPTATDKTVEVKRVSLEGSVTLVKKGIKWYIEDRK
jgi:hypothetical protein